MLFRTKKTVIRPDCNLLALQFALAVVGAGLTFMLLELR